MDRPYRIDLTSQFVHNMFDDAAAAFPLRVAIEETARRISYRDLQQRSNKLADLLAVAGAGRIVGVFLSPGIDLVTAIIALFRRGKIYMPLDIKFSREKLRRILNETFDGTLIVGSELKTEIQQLVNELAVPCSQMIILDRDGIAEIEKVNEGRWTGISRGELVQLDRKEPSGDSDNYLFYTSGSTGAGKAIVGRHKSLAHFIKWEIGEFEIDKYCRVSHLLQFTFDASLRDIFVPLCTGGTLVVPTDQIKFNTRRLIEWLSETGVTLVHTIPSVFRLLTKELSSTERLSNLRLILLAGEPVFGKDIMEWRSKNNSQVELVNLYGLTETTLLKTFHRIKITEYNDPSQPVHVGRPITHTEVLIVDNGKLCEENQRGEVFIRTDFLTNGYYGREDLTREFFVLNPLTDDVSDVVFRTGDIGYFDVNKNIFIEGRIDDQVKVNGIRVDPGEVQKSMLSMDGIEMAVVKGIQEQDTQMALAGYYVSDGIEPSSLRDHLMKVLNPGLVPFYLVRLESFPLNSNGKVDKNALPFPTAVRPMQVKQEPAHSTDEGIITSIWGDVLKTKESISTDISFFDIGGNSLKCIQLISRLYKRFGVLLTIADIYQLQTIKLQAKAIGTTKGHSREQIITPCAQSDSYELSHAQKRIWIVHSLYGNSAIANMPESFLVNGDLRVDLLNTAFRLLIDRHESLRTYFLPARGEVWQKVRQPSEVLFAIELLDESTNVQPYEVAVRLALEATQKSFNLTTDLLIRCHVFKYDHKKFVIVINTHHIIADEWSINILFRELFAIYRALGKNEDISLKPLKIQYKDYSAWHNRSLANGDFSRHEQFWAKFLENAKGGVHFPVDGTESVEGDSNEGVIQIFLDSETSQNLKELARKRDMSTFMILYAILNIQIARYTGRNDIVLGAPVTGRHLLELEDQIGYYVNVLPLRLIIEPDDTFDSVLLRTRERVLEVFDHLVFPVDLIISNLERDHGSMNERLFTIMIQAATPREEYGDLDIDIHPLNIGHQGKVDFKMSFKFSENDQNIFGSVGFDTRFYSTASVSAIVDDFCCLANKLLSGVDARLSDIEFLSSPSEDLEREEFLRSMLKL